MSKNSAAHQKKVEHAVRKILKAPGLSIPDAMILANFSKRDIANETVRRAHRAVKLSTEFMHFIGGNISITELIKKITIDGGDQPNLR